MNLRNRNLATLKVKQTQKGTCEVLFNRITYRTYRVTNNTSVGNFSVSYTTLHAIILRLGKD